MRGAAGSEPSIDGASSSSPGAVAGGGRRGRSPGEVAEVVTYLRAAVGV
jgi:hypothetical protein